MVASSFMRFGSSRGNDAAPIVAFGVGDEQYSPLNGADSDPPSLAILAVVLELQQKRIEEHTGSRPKIQAMLRAVASLFGGVPLKQHGLMVLNTSSNVKGWLLGR